MIASSSLSRTSPSEDLSEDPDKQPHEDIAGAFTVGVQKRSKSEDTSTQLDERRPAAPQTKSSASSSSASLPGTAPTTTKTEPTTAQESGKDSQASTQNPTKPQYFPAASGADNQGKGRKGTGKGTVDTEKREKLKSEVVATSQASQGRITFGKQVEAVCSQILDPQDQAFNSSAKNSVMNTDPCVWGQELQRTFGPCQSCSGQQPHAVPRSCTFMTKRFGLICSSHGRCNASEQTTKVMQ